MAVHHPVKFSLRSGCSMANMVGWNLILVVSASSSIPGSSLPRVRVENRRFVRLVDQQLPITNPNLCFVSANLIALEFIIPRRQWSTMQKDINYS
jgi:hypothetical protein